MAIVSSFPQMRVLVVVGLSFTVACSSATRQPSEDAGSDADGDADRDNDGDADPDGDTGGDECAAMDAREGPDTCDGGGWGYKWNGEDCEYQGDLCNCIGADCSGLYETVEACRDAFTSCIEADCGALTDALVAAFEAAVLCNPAMSSLQCDGAEMMTNQCGCPWAANNRHPDLAQTARDAWEPVPMPLGVSLKGVLPAANRRRRSVVSSSPLVLRGRARSSISVISSEPTSRNKSKLVLMRIIDRPDHRLRDGPQALGKDQRGRRPRAHRAAREEPIHSAGRLRALAGADLRSQQAKRLRLNIDYGDINREPSIFEHGDRDTEPQSKSFGFASSARIILTCRGLSGVPSMSFLSASRPVQPNRPPAVDFAAAPARSRLRQGLTAYRVQYVGIVRDGRQVIFTNFFCDTFGVDWRTQPVIVDDGGGCYFVVEFDLAAGSFSHLMINGEG